MRSKDNVDRLGQNLRVWKPNIITHRGPVQESVDIISFNNQSFPGLVHSNQMQYYICALAFLPLTYLNKCDLRISTRLGGIRFNNSNYYDHSSEGIRGSHYEYNSTKLNNKIQIQSMLQGVAVFKGHEKYQGHIKKKKLVLMVKLLSSTRTQIFGLPSEWCFRYGYDGCVHAQQMDEDIKLICYEFLSRKYKKTIKFLH